MTSLRFLCLQCYIFNSKCITYYSFVSLQYHILFRFTGSKLCLNFNSTTLKQWGPWIPCFHFLTRIFEIYELAKNAGFIDNILCDFDPYRSWVWCLFLPTLLVQACLMDVHTKFTNLHWHVSFNTFSAMIICNFNSDEKLFSEGDQPLIWYAI